MLAQAHAPLACSFAVQWHLARSLSVAVSVSLLLRFPAASTACYLFSLTSSSCRRGQDYHRGRGESWSVNNPCLHHRHQCFLPRCQLELTSSAACPPRFATGLHTPASGPTAPVINCPDMPAPPSSVPLLLLTNCSSIHSPAPISTPVPLPNSLPSSILPPRAPPPPLSLLSASALATPPSTRKSM